MRQFTLYNQTGASKSLMKGGDALAFDVTGLGAKLPNGIADIKNGFFRLSAPDAVPQSNICGNLVFLNRQNQTAYSAYTALINWMLSASELYFGYKPENTGTEYRCRIAVDYIQKTEQDGNILKCPFCFRMMSPWFTTTAVSYSMSATTTTSEKIYSANITASGHMPAAFKLVTTGGSTCKAPNGISLHNSGGTEIEGISIQEATQVSTRFEFSTEYGNSFFKSAASDDLSNNMFAPFKDDAYFRIPTDGTYALKVHYGRNATTPSTINLTVFQYFRTV